MSLNPQAQALIDLVKASGTPPRHLLPVEEGRRQFLTGAANFGLALEPLQAIEDRQLAGPDGNFGIRIYTPSESGPRPALIYFHGGGWTFGNLESHHGICSYLAHHAGCSVIAVDYPLSPEAKFPVALDAGWFATQWVFENAARLNIDPAQISIGGDSAGGNLAAAITLLARDRHGPHLASQILIYPVVDYYRPGTASYEKYAESYWLTADTMRWFWDNYLPDPSAGANPYVSPLRADLSGLPPALILLAEHDPLRDEGDRYAEKLVQANVPTRKLYYPHQMHAFLSQAGVIDEGRQALSQIADFLKAPKALDL